MGFNQRKGSRTDKNKDLAPDEIQSIIFISGFFFPELLQGILFISGINNVSVCKRDIFLTFSYFPFYCKR